MQSATRRCSSIPFHAIALAALCAAAPLSAEPNTGRLWVIVKVSDNVLADTPARASLTTPEGELVDYAEEFLTRAPNTQGFLLENLEPAVYDVRVEGEGMVTQVKKGVPIFAGRDERVSVVVAPGTGVRIVEYAVAGLSREEVASRLQALESGTAKLRAELEALKSRP